MYLLPSSTDPLFELVFSLHHPCTLVCTCALACVARVVSLFILLQESLRLAKEALKMDIGCGDSWYVLGNAYVASFFRSSRGMRDLDRALQAYKNAVRHVSCAGF